uniref:TTF-type domain-containing protein n=1 Tax=Arundo donax TaxID=35708 RepID=A0A0A9CNG4_ARUDO
MPPLPPPVFDPDRLSQDPVERLPIVSYPINDQDAVRRAYIMKGPFQPYAHQFKKRKIGTRNRSFNPVWFYKYHWLEYSIKNESAYCFVCYLFRKKGKGKGTDAFIRGG